MANLNRCILVGRLTRDVETRTFASGSMVAQLGFCVNNRRKNQQSDQWEDEPVFLDVEAFGKTAEVMAESLRKGANVLIEGHLKLDQWEKDGQKRSKLKVVVDSFQFLDPRSANANTPAKQKQEPREPRETLVPSNQPPEPVAVGEDIPF